MLWLSVCLFQTPSHRLPSWVLCPSLVWKRKITPMRSKIVGFYHILLGYDNNIQVPLTCSRWTDFVSSLGSLQFSSLLLLQWQTSKKKLSTFLFLNREWKKIWTSQSLFTRWVKLTAMNTMFTHPFENITCPPNCCGVKLESFMNTGFPGFLHCMPVGFF